MRTTRSSRAARRSERLEADGRKMDEGYSRGLKMLGIASGLGLEMALLVAAAALLASELQRRFELGVWVMLLSVGLAMAAFGLHLRHLLRRDESDQTEV